MTDTPRTTTGSVKRNTYPSAEEWERRCDEADAHIDKMRAELAEANRRRAANGEEAKELRKQLRAAQAFYNKAIAVWTRALDTAYGDIDELERRLGYTESDGDRIDETDTSGGDL